MGCDCDSEYPEFYREQKRKAAKPHTCSDCRGVINKKEGYLSISGMWDGTFFTYKRCADCMHLVCQIPDEGCRCIPLGGLINWLDDAQSYGSTYHRLGAMFNAYAEARGSKRRVLLESLT